MKPIIEIINSPCAHCSKPFNHEVLFRVDGKDYPELKKRVLNYTAFTSKCPACNRQSIIPQHFKYFDTANGVRYVIYYFPKGSEGQLEDIIAGVSSLRDFGIKTHFVHKIKNILEIINQYETGKPPPENDFPVGEAAIAKIRALSIGADDAKNIVMNALQNRQETGDFPPDFIETIKRGKVIIDAQNQQDSSTKKPSLFKRIFGL